MTPAEAAALYVQASIDGAYVLWFITFGPCAPSKRALAAAVLVRAG